MKDYLQAGSVWTTEWSARRTAPTTYPSGCRDRWNPDRPRWGGNKAWRISHEEPGRGSQQESPEIAGIGGPRTPDRRTGSHIKLCRATLSFTNRDIYECLQTRTVPWAPSMVPTHLKRLSDSGNAEMPLSPDICGRGAEVTLKAATNVQFCWISVAVNWYLTGFRASICPHVMLFFVNPLNPFK